ncbi:hypothetical protein GGI12_002310 [Dipsacomyces acuminosporus]|nr:hypothetical protein GGI12_002310 [Dipsacomyces acuminosporus]
MAQANKRFLSGSFVLAKEGSRPGGNSPLAADRARSQGHGKDDRFQYDMKAPLLDAGMANMFQVDENMLSVAENLLTGFRLSNGQSVYGPLLIVNNEAFTLKIPPPKVDAAGRVANPLQLLDPKALEILNVVTPKPEIIVVGGGANTSPLSPDARKYLTSIGINVEFASTRYASSTFNTLSEEGRHVALLAIPSGVKI